MNPFGVKYRRAKRSSGQVVMRTVSPGASGRPASSAAARAMFAALVIVFAPAEALEAQDPSTDGPMAVVRAFVHANETADLEAAHLGPVPALPVDQPTSFARRTFVLRRAGQRWLIVHLHASNVLLTPPR